MDFLTLEICNFLVIGQSGVLNLHGRGLVAIQGVNLDDDSATSNGGGKSSIPDALSWCAFGETARGEAGDAIVNDKAKKDCWVKTTLRDGEIYYAITRYRKHKEFKNQLHLHTWKDGDAPTALTKGTEKETQKLIEQIIGCTYEVFKAAIYAGQEAMPNIPAMTDKELKLLVEQGAGIDRLERAYEIARQREANIASAIIDNASAIAAGQARLASLTHNKATVDHDAAEFEKGRAARKAEAQSRAGGYAAAMKATHTAMKAIDREALTKEAGEIAEKLRTHNLTLAQKDNLARTLSKTQMGHTQAQFQLQNAEHAVKSAQAALESAERPAATKCHACGTALTPENKTEHIAHARESLRQAEAETPKCKDTVSKWAEAVALATKALNDFVATIPDVSALTARTAEINGALNSHATMLSQLQLLKKDYDMEQAKADHCMGEPNPHAAALKMVEGQITKERDSLTVEIGAGEVLAKDKEIAAAVTQVYSPGGVRAQILDTVTPFLNERTSEYLNAISEGNLIAVWSTLGTTAKGELREKFNIAVENLQGSKGFGLLSGGEKRKVRLATMLALQDLVAARATKPLSLLVLDEIDDALDVAGLERLMTIVEKKARDKGTVLMISHNDLTDWCDQTATVTRKDKRSTIEGALCD